MTSRVGPIGTGIAPLGRRRGLGTNARRRAISLALLVVLLGSWEVAVRQQWLNPDLLVPPSRIGATLWGDLVSGRLWSDFRVSAIEFIVGYLLAIAIGVPLGLVIGAGRRVERALNPYVLGMYATPAQAWLPLLILALGIGAAPKIVLIVLFAVFVIILNTAAAVKAVDPVLVKVGRSFGASRLALFAKIVLPAASPLIVAGLRLAVGRAVIGVFLAEMIGANEGVGFYIMRSGTEFRVDRVFVGVLVLVLVSVALTELIRKLEDRLTPWRQRTQL